MERNLQTRIIAKGSSYSGHLLHSSFNSHLLNTDGCFNTNSSMSFQTVTAPNSKQTPFHPFHGSSSDYPIKPSLLGYPYSLLSGPTHLQQYQATPPEEQPLLMNSLLKTPKSETLSDEEEEEDRFNYISQNSYKTLMLCNSTFRHLPVIRSLNQVSDNDFSALEPRRKSLRPSSSSTDSWTLNPSSFAGLQPLKKVEVPQSMLARMRRKKISEKTLCLQKLLPWDKKMDMATVLGETYKYIKFLKAQVTALESMPTESSFTFQSPSNVGGGYAGLEKLNRQQLLQVMVNSPVVQTMMYSNECCVVSLEQLILLKQITEQALFFGR